jgi:hypothetical protein
MSATASFFFYLVCEAIGTAATPGLLCQPRVIVKRIVEKQMGCRLAGETEVLGENLPQRHFCPAQNPTWQDPGLNPGHRGGKLATNRPSYGAAATAGYWTQWIVVSQCLQCLQTMSSSSGTMNPLKHNSSIRTICFIIQNPSILLIQLIRVFRMVLIISNESFPKRH